MLRTRLTERFKLVHPVLSAPMAFMAGAALASAVSEAGGLGLIGGGFSDTDWLSEQLGLAGNRAVGCGFITWHLHQRPELLDIALEHSPVAIFLSFGDPAPFAPKIKQLGTRLICQVQTLADARRAIEVGADLLVAQGAEAGGHGDTRATLTLVPEVADLIAARAPQTLLCAAGGIADGRGLAAALALGADGVLMGSRFYASQEARVHQNFRDVAVAATGDDTVRSQVLDIMLGDLWPWPERYSFRTVRSEATDRWQGREAELRASMKTNAGLSAEALGALASGDTRTLNAIVGEAAGLIHEIAPASEILERVVREAETILRQKAPTWLST